MSGKPGRSGRKKGEAKTFFVKLILQPGRHGKLIDFFEGIPRGRRAEAVIAALEGGNLADGLAIAQATEVSGQSDMIDALGEWDL